MLTLQHLWHRLTPQVRHRLELAFVAVLAFTLGMGVRGSGKTLSVFPTGNQPAMIERNGVSAIDSAAATQHAMELYRQGERTVPAYDPAALQRAMELYRQGEHTAGTLATP